MKLLIEGYPYKNHKPGSLGYNALKGLVNDIELESSNPVSVSYVGYFYSKTCNDVVFCLPKVVLTGGKKDGEDETVFGFSPEKLIDFEKLIDADKQDDGKEKTDEIKKFLSELAIWIYRTIAVYHTNYPDSQILKTEQYNTNSGGKKSKFHTLFDIIIALRDFNKENQNYFSFIARNQHSGNNKIQWSKTISKSQAVIQDGVPVYLNPVNKKKEINFDEELLVIYFSILKYIHKTYGFRFNTDLNYPLIEGAKFEAYRKGKGTRRLKAIKYKYFSDKDLRLWNLCYAFFDVTHDIAINMARQDFMLVDDFQIVFERVIDDLLGDKVFDKKAKNQADGKNIDHLYKGSSLLAQTNGLETYYIADSKYYKRSERATNEGETESYTALHGTSIPKQFTYARNLIQWNLDLFLKDDKNNGEIQLRPDELTEGYNVIPNFFISALIPDNENKFNFKNDDIKAQGQIDFSRQFENRLFDRDTLLLCHYDVNFLFVVSLYGRNNQSAQSAWKTNVRTEFRKKIQGTLDQLYEFYVLTPKIGQNCYQFVKDNFHQLNGKLYRPKSDSDCLILALLKQDAFTKDELLKKTLDSSAKSLQKELGGNDGIKSALGGYFDGTDEAVELKEDALADKFIRENEKTDKGLLKEMPSIDGEVVLVNYADKEHKKLYVDKELCYVRAGDSNGAIHLPSLGKEPKYLLLHSNKVESAEMYELKQIGARIYTKGQLEDKGFSPSQDGIYLVYELKNNSQVALDGIDTDALINRGKATQLPHFEIIQKKQNAIQKV